MRIEVEKVKANKVYKNTLFLVIIQLCNYVFPLITIPFLLKILGLNNFGIISLSQIFLSYLSVIVDYGYNLTGTRAISLNRDNKEAVETIFSSIIITKSLLSICCILIGIVVVFTVSKFNNYVNIYIISFFSLLAQVITPTWYYQGIEKLKELTIFNFFIKLLLTISIFLFIKETSDIVKYIFLTTCISVLGSLIIFFYTLYRFQLKLRKVNFSNIKEGLVEGFNVFLPTFFSNILTSGGIFVLGIFYSERLVGIYTSIDKFVKAFIVLLGSFTQSLFPNISLAFAESRKKAVSLIMKNAKLLMIFLMVCFIFTLFISKFFLVRFYGEVYNEYYYILNFLMFWVIISFLNNFIGIQFLVGSGLSLFYKKAFIISALLTLFSLILVKFYAIDGLLMSIFIGELSLTFVMVFQIIKYKL